MKGANRTFRVYRPGTLEASAPLVIMLHGGFGDGAQAERSYGWDSMADAGHFLVAYPDGMDRAWNVGGECCGRPGREGVNDVEFITTLVGRLQKQVRIDPARIYATGISNGGMLAYRLACDTVVFAAIGPDSATQLGPCPSPKPISILHIHGASDKTIPYNGGRGTGVAQIDGPAVPQLLGTWRMVDGCAAPVVDTTGNVTTSSAECPGGRTVALITIAGAGHQWPGSKPKPVIERLLGLDPPSNELDATNAFWQFFATHPKP